MIQSLGTSVIVRNSQARSKNMRCQTSRARLEIQAVGASAAKILPYRVLFLALVSHHVESHK